MDEGESVNRVSVLGSLNMDLVVKVKAMPEVGQTIMGEDFTSIPGGKGANQAVAARRLGAEVNMIGKVGADANGQRLISELQRDNINTEFVFVDKQNTTGTAVITVNEEGNNSIIVIAGANMQIEKQELQSARAVIENSNVLVAQFETSIEITLEAFKYAKEKGLVTILNPAPAKSIPEELLRYTDIIVPNETEALYLTGIEVKDIASAKEAGMQFINKGTKYVIITLGDKGAVLMDKDNCELIPAFKVKAIDTTAAGDSFIGGISVKINFSNLKYEALKSAVEFANKVSSLSVQRKGAQPSIPTLSEVMKAYK